MREKSIWGRLGTLLRREGTEQRVSAIFYRAVVQVFLLTGSETWVLLATMEKKVGGGTH